MGASIALVTSLLILGGCAHQTLPAEAPGAVAGMVQTPRLDAEQQRLVEAARAAGATGLEAVPRADGGLLLGGKLEGDQFALVIPKDWNRQAMLFAHGYSTPNSPVDVAKDPLEASNDPIGVFETPYRQGFAVGHSAYDKAGMGVESAVVNTLRLKRFADKLGNRRMYLIGGSMGGNIVVALAEKYPEDFAGVIPACGAVGEWPVQLAWMGDVQAAYNYFAAGTPYEIPGGKDITKSALPSPADARERMANMMRVATPIYQLFAAARKNPGGPEQRIIDNVAAAAHTFPDPAAFASPIITLALGMDDLNETFGGSIFDNRRKVYRSPLLDAKGNAKLNAGIQRVKADSAAIAKANQWYKATGKLGVPMLSIYNSTDSLVPTDLHENMLRAVVHAAGNDDKLVQRAVPPVQAPMPGAEQLQGMAHCGFTKEQIKGAWDDLRAWVETGRKPVESPAPAKRTD